MVDNGIRDTESTPSSVRGHKQMVLRWALWALVSGCVAVPSVGCDLFEDEPSKPAAAGSEKAPAAAAKPESDDDGSAAPPEADPVAGQLDGTVDNKPFVTRGVLAHRRSESDPKIEIRLFGRAASCASFDSDYQSRPGEPIAIINLEWPRSEGDRVSFGAANRDDRLQFCEGKEGRRGRASCRPRAQEQGSLTVLEASATQGVLSLDVASPQGSLSGRLEFTLCSDPP
jgi:hypothetical protein